jgi:hypothetical protein
MHLKVPTDVKLIWIEVVNYLQCVAPVFLAVKLPVISSQCESGDMGER